jgi:hypothetical protein
VSARTGIFDATRIQVLAAGHQSLGRDGAKAGRLEILPP